MVRPGTGVLVLGFAAMQGLDLVQMSEPVLRDLAAETGETVNLGALYGDQVLFVARIPRRDTLVAANLRVGSTVPAVFSSIGKTILAYLSADELGQRITADSFRGAWGPQAVTTIDALSAQLESARQDGYLVQRDEAIPGLSSIAAPITAGRRHRVGRGQRGRAERRVRQRAAHRPVARAPSRRQPRDLPPDGRHRPPRARTVPPHPEVAPK